jgi:hypothetical protein
LSSNYCLLQANSRTINREDSHFRLECFPPKKPPQNFPCKPGATVLLDCSKSHQRQVSLSLYRACPGLFTSQ